VNASRSKRGTSQVCERLITACTASLRQDCRATGSPSTEHVVPKWVPAVLQISEPAKEHSGSTYVGATETLAIVFREVFIRCKLRCPLNVCRDDVTPSPAYRTFGQVVPVAGLAAQVLRHDG